MIFKYTEEEREEQRSGKQDVPPPKTTQIVNSLNYRRNLGDHFFRPGFKIFLALQSDNKPNPQIVSNYRELPV